MLKQLMCPNTNNKDDDTELNQDDPDPEFSITQNIMASNTCWSRHLLAESEPCNLCPDDSRRFSQLRHPLYQMVAHKKIKSFSFNK